MKMIEFQFQCSQESNCQSASIGSGNGFGPKGNKPLPEPMMTQFIDTYMQHQEQMS